MQDIHSIGGGGGGRMFGAGGERRIRPHHHQNAAAAAAALKCPRCDSSNTKFCYYNNYNLSQPRHFCKSCRRYWTKGGVLRNVPVGGGCRKTKRSSSKPKTAPSREPNIKTTTVANSRSSSDTEALSAPSSSSSDPLKEMLNPNTAFTMMDPGSDCGLFSDMGSLTGLIGSNNNEPLGSFGLLDQTVLNQQQQQSGEDRTAAVSCEIKLSEMAGGGGLLDQTVQVELSALQGRSNGGEFGTLDWQDGGDQGLFDLTNTVDHAYWSQTSEWTDQVQDHHHNSLYLP